MIMIRRRLLQLANVHKMYLWYIHHIVTFYLRFRQLLYILPTDVTCDEPSQLADFLLLNLIAVGTIK